MACAQGYATRLSINGQQMDFNQIKPLTMRELVDNSDVAIRGILDHPKEKITIGRLHIGFEVTMNPSPAELDVLLPLMGGSESPTDTFTIGDTYSTFTSVVDYGTKVHHYTNCKAGRAVFFGQRGAMPIGLTLQVLGTGLSEDTSFGTPTALDLDIVYAFHEGVLTYSSTEYNFDRFQLVIDPHLQVQWNNSATPTEICATNRTILLSTNVPYTSSEASLLTTPLLTNADGAAASLAFTRSGESTTFTFANLKSVARPPAIPGKTALRLPLNFRCYRSSTSPALTVTNDSTA